MAKHEIESSPRGHWLVLFIGLSIAIGIWALWTFQGMYWTHARVSTKVTSISSAGNANTVAVTPSSTPRTEQQLDRERLFAELGQTGDSFGGINALLTAIAGALVAWAGYMQHLALKAARTEAQLEREHRHLQEFESLFFQLIAFASSITERIEGPRRSSTQVIGNRIANASNEPPRPRHGSRALDAFATLIYDSVTSGPDPLKREERLAALVQIYTTKVYDRHPSALGPYFRLQFQTFKHIAEAELSESAKVRYSNIARGQIS